jgi:hypothetical protein
LVTGLHVLLIKSCVADRIVHRRRSFFRSAQGSINLAGLDQLSAPSFQNRSMVNTPRVRQQARFLTQTE